MLTRLRRRSRPLRLAAAAAVARTVAVVSAAAARARRHRRARAVAGFGPGSAAGAPPAEAVQEMLRLAQLSFLQVQAAWDRRDLGALGLLAAPGLLEELRDELAEHGDAAAGCTEVVSLQARLLALEDLQDALLASVEFSGLIREHGGGTPASPFRELWLLANVKAVDRGWQLARVQALS